MARYTIENTDSGIILGIYEGENELDAYQEMLRDAGYDSPSDLPSHMSWDEIPKDLSVTETE